VQGFLAGDVSGPQFVRYQALEAGRIQFHGSILPALEADAQRAVEVERRARSRMCGFNHSRASSLMNR
jgi:hypothetical protein